MMVHTPAGLNPTSQARIGRVLSRCSIHGTSPRRRCRKFTLHRCGISTRLRVLSVPHLQRRDVTENPGAINHSDALRRKDHKRSCIASPEPTTSVLLSQARASALGPPGSHRAAGTALRPYLRGCLRRSRGGHRWRHGLYGRNRWHDGHRLQARQRNGRRRCREGTGCRPG